MSVAAQVKKLLDTSKVAYRVYPHARIKSLIQISGSLGIPATQILTTQVLADDQGMILAVYPLAAKIDVQKIKKLLNRNLKVLSGIKVNRIFNDCDAGCWPPIGQAYGLDVILDKSLRQQQYVYFSSGSYTSLVQMLLEDYLHLQPRAKLLDFVTPVAAVDRLIAAPGPSVADGLQDDRKMLLDTLAFPDLPPIALKILQLSIDGAHSTPELLDIISQDPLIHQQILLYTELKNKTVQDVVEHVLGFDMVSHIALGVAAGRAFTLRAPTQDSMEFWRHAFYAAAYAERITQLVAESQHLDPAISYLAGLFHNMGLLLFSQLFQPEYALLKKWIRLNPKVSIAVLEKRLLGMGQALNIVRGGHAQLGEWLLRHWGMPESICVIAKEHHSLLYKGKFAPYVKIIQIANQLLREDGIGDGSQGGISEQLLEPLGLTAAQVISSVKNIQAGSASLEQMVQSLHS